MSETGPQGNHPTPLATAARQRTLDAEQRVRSALKQMDREGLVISFASVAHHAEVGRAFLYGHEFFRAEIQQLRQRHQETSGQAPLRHRASDESLRSRLKAALEDNRQLREESAALREELAISHGRVRELELDLRARR